MTDVIRYGAGGKPYVGQVGPKSTEAMPAPVEEEKEPESVSEPDPEAIMIRPQAKIEITTNRKNA